MGIGRTVLGVLPVTSWVKYDGKNKLIDGLHAVYGVGALCAVGLYVFGAATVGDANPMNWPKINSEVQAQRDYRAGLLQRVLEGFDKDANGKLSLREMAELYDIAGIKVEVPINEEGWGYRYGPGMPFSYKTGSPFTLPIPSLAALERIAAEGEANRP